MENIPHLVAKMPARVRWAVENWRDDRPYDVRLYPAYGERMAHRVWSGRWRYRLTPLGQAVRMTLIAKAVSK